MQLSQFIETIESSIPLSLQEPWDNSGLQVGDRSAHVSAALLCVDVTEAVIDEAIAKQCQVVVSHHPLLFSGLKNIEGKTAVERCVIKAIRHNIAIYSIHTNADNWYEGVNMRLGAKIGLTDCTILSPQGEDHEGKPYGLGLIGRLPHPEDEAPFLDRMKQLFGIHSIRHTALLDRPIERVALCGGSGASFLDHAKAQRADIYISADFKYHEFFQAEEQIIIADLGHYETEKHTKDIFFELISKKMPTFAHYLSETDSSPILYR